jgi:spore germination protein GerM
VTGRGRTIGALAGLFAAAVVLSSCGVPENATPRALDGEVPYNLLASTTTVPSAGLPDASGDPVVLYFLDDEGRLVPAHRQLPPPVDHNDLVDLLFDGVSDAELGDQLNSAIAPGTRLLGVDGPDEDGVLTLDITDDLLRVTGRRQSQAIAQIVWTATQLEGVESVLFEIEGKPTEVLSGNGNPTPVPLARRHFRTLEPTTTTSTTVVSPSAGPPPSGQ